MGKKVKERARYLRQKDTLEYKKRLAGYKSSGVTRIWDVKRRHKTKVEVLAHYGGGKCSCVRCGFKDIRALTIDHINNDGSKERVDGLYRGGSRLYRMLRANNYPTGFQTLCMNCQWIKRAEFAEEIQLERFGKLGLCQARLFSWARC